MEAMRLVSTTRLISWLLIGTGLSFAISAGSSLGHQVTRQNQLSDDWSRSHRASAAVQPGSVLTLKRPRLSAGQPLARINVPSINWAGIVLEGTEPQVLSGGPGHLVGTAYPGEPDNVVISNPNAYSQQWSGLRLGDSIELATDYGSFSYKVSDLRIAGADDKSLTGSRGRASMTFIACYPLWAGALGTQRYVAFADLQS
jgi:LPXTG-site transpeptidase (sortase) family protein